MGRRPPTFLILVGGEEFKLCQLAHHQLWSQQGPHFGPHSTAKTNDKSTFLRKNDLLHTDCGDF